MESADLSRRLEAEAAYRFQRFDENEGRIFSRDEFDVGLYQISPNFGAFTCFDSSGLMNFSLR